MASYNIFNYNYRPAKSIERKILIELLKEVYGVIDSKKCTYIGFGSIFFSDFRMIHKELGIKKMINIENNVNDKPRFEYNKPFSCIELLWGDSTDILPNIDWNGKKIIWLDYDETLQSYMFEDLEIVFSNIEPGSFYFFSCNNSLPKYFDRVNNTYKIDEFRGDFEGYTPFDLNPEMLTVNQSPFLIRTMINSQIDHIIGLRNAILEEEDKLCYCQMFFLTYKDRAPMISTGGVIIRRRDVQSLRDTKIFTLPYVRTDDSLLDIQTPILTNSEIDLVNSHLPKPRSKFLRSKKLKFIPEEEKSKYHSIYRYYPSYVEIRDF